MIPASPCPACGATETTATVEQGIREHTLRWRETITCAACGEATHRAHEGLPPAAIRTDLLAAGGVYALHTADTLTLTDLRCLQHSTGISLPELVTVKKRTPGTLFTGTEMEVTFLRDCLPEGVVSVQPAADAPADCDVSASIAQPAPVWERPSSWRGSGKAGCTDEE